MEGTDTWSTSSVVWGTFFCNGARVLASAQDTWFSFLSALAPQQVHVHELGHLQSLDLPGRRKSHPGTDQGLQILRMIAYLHSFDLPPGTTGMQVNLGQKRKRKGRGWEWSKRQTGGRTRPAGHMASEQPAPLVLLKHRLVQVGQRKAVGLSCHSRHLRG